MSIGVDGVLGLRSGLKTYQDLVQDSSWSKRMLVELYPGKAVSDWSLSTGAVYVAAVDVQHDNVRLDVAKVSSVLDAELTRNRTSPTLGAGEYYYDVDTAAAAARWDDGVTQWDDGATQWDQFPALFVRMSDDSDPSNTDVEAELLLAFGSSAENHPILGPDLLTNGAFENADSAQPSGTAKSGLVSWWDMDETVGTRFDSVGSLDLADLGPSPVDFAGGVVGNAVDISAGQVLGTTYDPGVGDFSFSVWFQTSKDGVYDRHGLVSFGEQLTVGQRTAILAVKDSTGYLHLYYNNAEPTGSTDVADGLWHHAAFVREGTSWKVYLDGETDTPEISVTDTPIQSTDDRFYVGAIGWGGSFLFYQNGLIDLVGLWDRALTTAEVGRLYNGGFGAKWAGWTETTSFPAGGTAVVAENADPLIGETCFSVVLADAPSGGSAYVYQVPAVVAGRTYRFCGAYRTEGTGVRARLTVEEQTGNTQAMEDGLNWAASESSTLSETSGEWKRWTWDVIPPAGVTSLSISIEGVANGMGQGTVSFDDVHLYPVDRIMFYEPRISGSSIPTIGTGSNDIFFGGKQVGTGRVALLNHDGYFETLLGLDWINRKCILKVGGGYLPDETGDPELIASDDYRSSFTGLIQEFKVDDLEASFSLQDIRSTYFKTLPPKTYEETTFSGIAVQDIGRVRPLWFGAKSGIRPIRVNVTGDGYGTYELADCTEAPNGIKAITNVWAYPSKVDAGARDTVRRVPLNYKAVAVAWTPSANMTVANEHIHKTAGSAAWTEGARSTSTVGTGAEDWYVEATVGRAPATYRQMLGITTDNPDWNYTSLDYALDPEPTAGYDVWENGVGVAFTQSPAIGDRMRIWVHNGVVEYYVNGTLLYTSVIAPLGNYYVRTANYTNGSMLTAVYVYKATALRYTEDLTNGQLTVTDDCGPYEVIAGEDAVSFGTSLTATLQPGLYSGQELATQLGGAMAGAAALTTYSASYSETTHLITIAGPSHSLEVSSGTDKKLYGLLGFTGSDRAAGTSHVGDVALFTDADTDHVIRVDGQGFKDDASGTYTGSANALIEKGADILRAISLVWLRRPATLIDEASFSLARARAAESLGAYMNSSISTKAIFETLEFSNIGNISIGGDGTIFFDVYVGEIPPGTVTVGDVDFVSFGIVEVAEDVYKTIRVNYDEDPEGLDYPSRFVTNDSAQARFGRSDSKDFDTWLIAPDGAQAAANRMGELAKVPAQQLRGTVRGKLLDHRVGQKIRVTRSRAASTGGLLSNAVYRILSLKQNHALGMTQVQAIPDVVTVAGVACETACQAFCETTCQATCEAACQSTCQVTCQVGCQVACQDCTQTTCQTICEVSCQTGCEVDCQACQGACQTGCQITCQTSCQTGCQTGCEVSCQDTCETACQSACEAACQESCQLFCQTSCQLFCQDTCQTSCQSAYQLEYFP